MSVKSRYAKLHVWEGGPVTAKNSIAGCVVIADYMDDASQRTIVVERPAPVAGRPAPKPRYKKADAKAPATSFDPEQARG